MNKIMRVSYYFKLFFKFLFAIFIVIFISSWVASLSGIKPIPNHALISFIGGLFSFGTTFLFLYFTIKLFQKYEKGKLFTLENVSILRILGFIFIFKTIVPALFLALIHLNVMYGLTSIDFEILLMGILLIFNSWIMKESYLLKEDQCLTI